MITRVISLMYEESWMVSKTKIRSNTYMLLVSKNVKSLLKIHEWYQKNTIQQWLTLGSKTKETRRLSTLIGLEHLFTQVVYTMVWVQGIKNWSSAHVALISCHILVVPTWENTPPNLRSWSSSLGPILRFCVSFLNDVLCTPSFLDSNSNVNPPWMLGILPISR